MYPNQQDAYWFLVRKGIFQVLLPSILALYSLMGYSQGSSDSAYSHLYFYSALLLMIQTIFRYIAEYIFGVCSIQLAIKQSEGRAVEGLKIIRVFRTKYSSFQLLERMVKLCNTLGIDSPLWIPQTVLDKFDDGEDISEEERLWKTIEMIHSYRPQVYSVVALDDPKMRPFDATSSEAPERISIGSQIVRDDSEGAGRSASARGEPRAPRRVITSLDASIGNLQFELFGSKSHQDYGVGIAVAC